MKPAMPSTDRLRTHPINVTITAPDGRVLKQDSHSIGYDPMGDMGMVLWLVRLSMPWGEDRVAQRLCWLGVDLPSHIPIDAVGPIVASLDR